MRSGLTWQPSDLAEVWPGPRAWPAPLRAGQEWRGAALLRGARPQLPSAERRKGPGAVRAISPDHSRWGTESLRDGSAGSHAMWCWAAPCCGA